MKFDLKATIAMWNAHKTKIIDILTENRAKIDSGKSPEWMPCVTNRENSGCGEESQQCATLTIGKGTSVEYTNFFPQHCVLKTYCKNVMDPEKASPLPWVNNGIENEDSDKIFYTCNAIKVAFSATVAAIAIAVNM